MIAHERIGATLSYEGAPGMERVVRLAREPMMRDVCIRFKRTLRDRLFSRPWEPWLSHVEFFGMVELQEIGDMEDQVAIAMRGEGNLKERLIRP